MNTHNPYKNQSYLTFGIQILLIINIAIYLIEGVFKIPIRSAFALHADWMNNFAVWQLLSYQFVHSPDIMHIIFNMLALFFLGPEVERGLGTNRFFILYFLSGILGGLGWAIISPPGSTCVGASGAVLGVLAAFAALYPNRELYIWGILPVKAWLLVIILGAYELSQTLSGPGGGIANAAHLSGGIAGYIYTTVIARPDVMRKIKKKFEPTQDAPIDKLEINRILDKVASRGLHSLTPSERKTLKRAGKQ